jgi:hypothetical protein
MGVRDPQDVTGLFAGQALDVAQHDDLALDDGQVRDGGLE